MKILKHTILAFGMILFMTPAFAQSNDNDCFKDWYSLFRERGANRVTDGTHEVVLSLRKGEYSQCFMGKVKVLSGRIVPPLMIAKEDGTFEDFTAMGKKISPATTSGKSEEELLTITDGMSMTYYTTDNETAKLFFYTFVKSKSSANKVAPPVKELIKN